MSGEFLGLATVNITKTPDNDFHFEWDGAGSRLEISFELLQNAPDGVFEGINYNSMRIGQRFKLGPFTLKIISFNEIRKVLLAEKIDNER